MASAEETRSILRTILGGIHALVAALPDENGTENQSGNPLVADPPAQAEVGNEEVHSQTDDTFVASEGANTPSPVGSVVAAVNLHASNLSLHTVSEASITPPPDRQRFAEPPEGIHYNNRPAYHIPPVRPNTQYPQFPVSSNGFVPHRVTLKIRDVGLLKLHELQGIESHSRLERFFREIELCSMIDQDRINVAMTRAEGSIVDFLKSEMDDRGNNATWREVKDILRARFVSRTSWTEAFKEIEAETYSLDETPRGFSNRLICKFAALKTRFPYETLPDMEYVIKMQLQKGLTKTLQDRMVLHLSPRSSLEEFLRFLEPHYNSAVIQGDVTRRRVQAISTPSSSQLPSNHSDHNSSRSDPATLDLMKQVSELKGRLDSLSSRSSNRRYCAFCMVRDHNLAECPKNPPRGVCFDCLKPQCKRGHVNCPGRRPDE